MHPQHRVVTLAILGYIFLGNWPERGKRLRPHVPPRSETQTNSGHSRSIRASFQSV